MQQNKLAVAVKRDMVEQAAGRVPELLDQHAGANPQLAAVEQWIFESVAARLMKKFPHFDWYIYVDCLNQQLIVSLPAVSTRKGYHIDMSGRNIHMLTIKAERAAAEILERHGLSRAKNADPRDNVLALPRSEVRPAEVDEGIVTDSKPESDHGIK